MNKNKGPFRLVLNGKASKGMNGTASTTAAVIMKRFSSGAEVAKIGVNPSKLAKTFADYNRWARRPSSARTARSSSTTFPWT